MKFDKVVAFGDSFVWGDELLDPALANHPHAHPVLMENTAYREANCFLGSVGRHYDRPVQNFGWPGASLQSTIWTYLWWIDHETLPLDRCLVLVGLTDSNRHSFYNPNHEVFANDPPWHRFMHTSWIHSGASQVDSQWRDFGKIYMLLTDCAELCQLHYQQAVLFFHGQCPKHAGLLQFNTIHAPRIMQETSLIWPDTSLQAWLAQQGANAGLTCTWGHPNEQGHHLIADRLIPEIDRATLT